ncbi:unnamed protein product, partial [Symbiodinium sp. CCMP2456]
VSYDIRQKWEDDPAESLNPQQKGAGGAGSDNPYANFQFLVELMKEGEQALIA